MRWSNLTIEAEDSTRLPGYSDEAVVRRFDAPEALDTRFYEVRAKSALNRVPEKSRMPFRWTVNPYRGCSHACSYCAVGDTPVLMADGRHMPLAELKPGDEIYGTTFDGKYRRYTGTTVLDHWSTIRPAHRTILSDGTELITSADHRFLTGRGWKHVVDAERPHQRPHLTPGLAMLGTGGFVAQAKETEGYRRGYLTGMIRGDGHLGTYSYDRPGRTHGDVYRFRLALADDDALARSEEFLAAEGIGVSRFAFHAANERHRQITAIRTQSRDNVLRIGDIIEWPLSPSDDWRKGYLAGIFDAEGSAGCGEALRICNGDPIILGWIEDCLRHFAFRVTRDKPAENGCVNIRFFGGLPERMRFLHLTDPAITRKRDIEGLALKSPKPLTVVGVEPVGLTTRMYDITTGTGDFVSDGVVSHNCFARPTHTYLGFDAGRDFEREIVVKVNVPEVLRAEVMKPRWSREHVAMGTNTDPYQWVEGRYKLMRPIWEAMRDSRTPCSILTKSPLLLRDLDKLLEVAAVTEIGANLSIPTMEEKAWRASEPRTPNPRARMEAVAELNRAGIPTGILVAPLMPGINDDPRQVEAILDAALEAGATSVGGQPLFLRGEVRGVFMDWLRTARPDLVERYEELYARGAYLPTDESDRLRRLLRRPGVPPSRFRSVTRRTPETVPPPPPRPAARQEALF